jgi:phospholipid transport system substrate-binding protein
MKTVRLAAVIVLTLGLTMPVWAGPPTDQVRQYTDQVLKIMQDSTLRAPDKRFERRAAVRKVAIQVFDVEETAKRALGRHWRERTPAERAEFVDLFADLLERTYIGKIDLYGGEQIRYVNESVDGDHAIVRARIITKRDTEVPVDAKMLRKADRWAIYDIAIENISLIGNYRAQFDQIIRTASYPELVRRLKDKNSSMAEDSPPSTRVKP